jgi:hypothetical protein
MAGAASSGGGGGAKLQLVSRWLENAPIASSSAAVVGKGGIAGPLQSGADVSLKNSRLGLPSALPTNSTPLLPADGHTPADPIRQPSRAAPTPRRQSGSPHAGAHHPDAGRLLESRCFSTTPSLLDLDASLDVMSDQALHARRALLVDELERVERVLVTRMQMRVAKDQPVDLVSSSEVPRMRSAAAGLEEYVWRTGAAHDRRSTSDSRSLQSFHQHQSDAAQSEQQQQRRQMIVDDDNRSRSSDMDHRRAGEAGNEMRATAGGVQRTSYMDLHGLTAQGAGKSPARAAAGEIASSMPPPETRLLVEELRRKALELLKRSPAPSSSYNQPADPIRQPFSAAHAGALSGQYGGLSGEAPRHMLLPSQPLPQVGSEYHVLFYGTPTQVVAAQQEEKQNKWALLSASSSQAQYASQTPTSRYLPAAAPQSGTNTNSASANVTPPIGAAGIAGSSSLLTELYSLRRYRESDR